MNELIFTLQIIIVSLFLILAARQNFLLLALVTISIFLADFTAIKQAPLFNLSSIGSEIYISTAMIALFILQEKNGAKATLEGLFGCIMLQGISLVLSQLHLAYVPSVFDINSLAYYDVFHNSPQIFMGTVIAFPISMLIGIKLFEYLAFHFSHWPFWYRLGLCYLPVQILNTILFILTGLLGLAHAPIVNTIVAVFLLKILAFIAFIPALILIKKLILRPQLNANSPL